MGDELEHCPRCDEEVEIVETVPWQSNICSECRNNIE